MNQRTAASAAMLSIAVIVAGVVLLAMWGLPRCGVYKQGLAGEAELANANYSRQVAVRGPGEERCRGAPGTSGS